MAWGEGYDKYKDTDIFILAPDEQLSRTNMMTLITDSFTHYYEQMNTVEIKNFKHLRKTYITAQFLKHGADTHKITENEDMGTLLRHYIDDNAVTEAR